MGHIAKPSAMRGIKTIEAANQFLLEEYLNKYNTAFSVEPEGESIKVKYQNQVFAAIQYLKPERKDANVTVTSKVIRNVQPHLIHSSDKWKLIWHGESYDLSLKFLYELFFDENVS